MGLRADHCPVLGNGDGQRRGGRWVCLATPWRQNGRARACWVVAVGQRETGDTQTVDGPFALYYLGTVPQDSGPHRRTGNSNV